jgi:hypothetical protein
MRLVPSTTEYLDMVRAAVPELEALLERQDREHNADGGDDDLLVALLDYLRAAVAVDDAPGTPASIAALLAALGRSDGQG